MRVPATQLSCLPALVGLRVTGGSSPRSPIRGGADCARAPLPSARDGRAPAGERRRVRARAVLCPSRSPAGGARGRLPAAPPSAGCHGAAARRAVGSGGGDAGAAGPAGGGGAGGAGGPLRALRRAGAAAMQAPAARLRRAGAGAGLWLLPHLRLAPGTALRHLHRALRRRPQLPAAAGGDSATAGAAGGPRALHQHHGGQQAAGLPPAGTARCR